jgi:hypothetical protein
MADGGSDRASAASPAPTADDKVDTPAPPDDDFDSVESERVDVLGRKRENAIPHSRVKAMIAKKEAAKEKALITSIAKELGITKAEAELRLEDVTGHISQSKAKLAEHEQLSQQKANWDKWLGGDVDQAIKLLAQHDKRYEKFLAPAAAPAAPAGPVADANDPEPQPDMPITDENGKVTGYTFSIDGLAKARAWDRRQAAREAAADIGKRIEPFEKERAEREQKEREAAHAKELDAAIEREAKTQLDWAEKQPLFKEHQQEIYDAVTTGKMNIYQAYNHVVHPKLTSDRAKMRAELLAEINKQPVSTSTPASTAAMNATSKTPSTADIAAQVMKELNYK